MLIKSFIYMYRGRVRVREIEYQLFSMVGALK